MEEKLKVFGKRLTFLQQVEQGIPENPFLYPHKNPLNWYEVFKMGLMTCLGVPFLRFAGVLLTFAVAIITCILANIGFNRIDDQGNVRPMPQWRRTLFLWPLPFFAYFLLFCFGFYRTRWHGRWANAPVAVSNHCTFVDGIFIFTHVVAMVVAMSDLRHDVLVGPVLTALQAIFVERTDKGNKKSVLEEMKRRVKLREFPTLLVFPEGTTTNNRILIQFKRGAFSLKVPVQPIVLDFKRNKYFDLSWTADGPGTFSQLFQMLCQFENHADVTFMPVHIPSQKELMDPALFAENVRRDMAKCLGAGMTSHSLEDSLLFLWSAQSSSPLKMKTTVAELKKSFSIRSVKDLKIAIKTFEEFDLNGDGLIGYDEFLHVLKIDDSSYSRLLFDSLDTSGIGSLDFDQFLLGMFMFTQPRDGDEAKFISLAFKMFGVDPNRLINREQALSIWEKSSPRLSRSEVQEKVNALFEAENSTPITFSDFAIIASERPDFLDTLPNALRTLLSEQAIAQITNDKKYQ